MSENLAAIVVVKRLLKRSESAEMYVAKFLLVADARSRLLPYKAYLASGHGMEEQRVEKPLLHVSLGYLSGGPD
jgi:hypothetical protein